MPRNKQFIDRAKAQLKTLRNELKQLEQTAACKIQLQKLRAELKRFGATVDSIAKGLSGHPAINQIKADAESHWLALETVIAAHRDTLKGRLANA
ncbi:MAG: hypothetical protein JXQ99_14440 [Hyphomicrobiaceae bacterium]